MSSFYQELGDGAGGWGGQGCRERVERWEQRWLMTWISDLDKFQLYLLGDFRSVSNCYRSEFPRLCNGDNNGYLVKIKDEMYKEPCTVPDM